MIVDPTPSTRRVGLVVPSSNITMEIEVPALLRRRRDDVSFHSSRTRMRHVSPEELAAMNAQSDRCIEELADAKCEVFAYACLVAVMAQGPGAHREIEARLQATAAAAGSTAPVVSSAGALVGSLHELGARRIVMIAPYVPTLTARVVDYLVHEGIEVASATSLGVADNLLVGCIPGDALRAIVGQLDVSEVDALVLSACVQMPSLGILDDVRRAVNVPVVTAASATADAIARALDGARHAATV
jgi:maleate isomerase